MVFAVEFFFFLEPALSQQYSVPELSERNFIAMVAQWSNPLTLTGICRPAPVLSVPETYPIRSRHSFYHNETELPAC